MINDPNRRAVVIFSDEENVIDFNQIIERDSTELTRSVTGGREQLYFQYDLPNTPTFLGSFLYYEGPYTYDDMQVILQNSTWSGQDSALDNTLILNLTNV